MIDATDTVAAEVEAHQLAALERGHIVDDTSALAAIDDEGLLL